MPGRFAKLKKNWLLRGWNDAPTTLVDSITGEIRHITRKVFYVAESCDGGTDFNSLAFLPEHHVILDALINEGIAEACPENDVIEPFQRYRQSNTYRIRGIHWCVTGLCNLKCRHCYMESPAGRYGQLPFEDMVRIIDQFEQANVLHVSLTGGEPFCRADIIEIIALLTQKRIGIRQIFTNALLITDDHLRQIKNMKISPSFQISFDGVGAHDSMRGTKGVEQKTVAAIQRVEAAGFPVVVATSLDRTNIGCLNDTFDLIREIGIEFWRLSSPQESGEWRGSDLALSLEEEEAALRPLFERWLNEGKPFELQLGRFYSSQASTAVGFPGFTPESFDCGTCREEPNLLPDGMLVPCPGYVDSVIQNKMPNILKDNLSMAWTQSYLREMIDLKKRDLFAANPECASCEWFKDCGMGCRASALTKTGDLTAKDPIDCALWMKGFKRRFNDMAG